MAHILSCPPEIRQSILFYLLPEEVRAFRSTSRTSALLPVVLTCKTLKADILELSRTWSPKFRLDRPQDVAELTDITEASGIQTLVLRLFAETEAKLFHESRNWVGGLQDMMPWVESVSSLPKIGARTVILDLTPAPMWMVRKRPDWVRATVVDRRCKLFFDYMGPGIERLIETIYGEYDGGISIQMGGMIGWKCRQPIFELIDGAESRHGNKVGFVGEWLSGDTQNPVHLSLPLISCRWGIPRQENTENIGWVRQQQTFRAIAKRGDRPKKPDLDLEALGPVSWSHNSTTSYYVNAQHDEDDARKTLVELLAFALKKREGSTNMLLDFPPAIKEKRRLIHRLAENLDLGSESVGDATEKFVRVSCRPHIRKTHVHDQDAPGRITALGYIPVDGNVCQHQEQQITSLPVVDSSAEGRSHKIRISISTIHQVVSGAFRDGTAKVWTAALRVLGHPKA